MQKTPQNMHEFRRDARPLLELLGDELVHHPKRGAKLRLKETIDFSEQLMVYCRALEQRCESRGFEIIRLKGEKASLREIIHDELHVIVAGPQKDKQEIVQDGGEGGEADGH